MICQRLGPWVTKQRALGGFYKIFKGECQIFPKISQKRLKCQKYRDSIFLLKTSLTPKLSLLKTLKKPRSISWAD